jgi:hypothetical protein
MVLFESDAGVFGETAGIGLKGMQEALNLSADLLVRLPLVSHPSLTRFGLHFHNTPPGTSSPAYPGTSSQAVAEDAPGFC